MKYAHPASTKEVILCHYRLIYIDFAKVHSACFTCRFDYSMY